MEAAINMCMKCKVVEKCSYWDTDSQSQPPPAFPRLDCKVTSDDCLATATSRNDVAALVFDDDGRPQRQGTVCKASVVVVASMLGSGVLALPWSIAQVGWIAGPLILLALAALTMYTSLLLCDLYRYMDTVSGKRLYSYTDAVHAYLGRTSAVYCTVVLYGTLVGTCIGYAITSANSMIALRVSECERGEVPDGVCSFVSSTFYIGVFGLLQLLNSQIRNFGEVWKLSILSVFMSLTYCGIAIGFGLSLTAEDKYGHGSLTGTRIGSTQGGGPLSKAFSVMNAVGAIAFSFDLSPMMFHIQDTLKSPPSESTSMRKATMIGVAITTTVYVIASVSGYAAFGNGTPGDFLSGLAGFNPSWLVTIGNICVICQLAASYQIFAQPVFAAVEGYASRRWPRSSFVNIDYMFSLPVIGETRFNNFRLTSRTIFVCLTTIIAMLVPFFTAIVGFLGSLSLWPIVVHFPLQMHIQRTSLAYWSPKWVALNSLSGLILIVAFAAVIGALHSIIQSSAKAHIFT